MSETASVNELPWAYGQPPLQGRLRSQPADFRVEEVLGYDMDGDGEHVVVHIEKTGMATDRLARELGRFAGVSSVGIGYAGLKDRHAITTQRISLHLAGKPDPDWTSFNLPEVRVLETSRHRRKLKRGALRGNRFVLVARELQGDREAAERVLAEIARHGVPNYFGEQRFGREGGNIAQARAMFAGRRVDRDTRSILLSAARSHIFNQVLAQRVELASWASGLSGEIWSLAGSRSWFGPESPDDTLRARLASGDIHPSGPLWGDGPSPASDEAGALEQQIAAHCDDLVQGLIAARMEQDRRALRLIPNHFSWHWLADDALELQFELPAGAYATTVLRELVSTPSLGGWVG